MAVSALGIDRADDETVLDVRLHREIDHVLPDGIVVKALGVRRYDFQRLVLGLLAPVDDPAAVALSRFNRIGLGQPEVEDGNYIP